MKNIIIRNQAALLSVLLAFFILISNSCNIENSRKDDIGFSDKMTDNKSHQDFKAVLKNHLNAVSNKDLKLLKSTMSPNGEMQLILPGFEIMYSVEKFMNYHENWFKDSTWTFETKILNTEIGDKVGLGVTEIVYREPDRNGEPYFNRMIVSYVLKKIDSNWYIIKDHASSIEKSTDKPE